jgi:hypothetical protein
MVALVKENLTEKILLTGNTTMFRYIEKIREKNEMNDKPKQISYLSITIFRDTHWWLVRKITM